MMSEDWIRREFSEFSLRRRPPKTDHFQAGIIDSGAKKVEQFKVKHYQSGIEDSENNEVCQYENRQYQCGDRHSLVNEVNVEISPCEVIPVRNKVVSDLILEITPTGSEEENSIEHDAFVISMSYPEGRQNLLEKSLRTLEQKGICISCGEKDKDLVCKHPLFKGSICPDCKDELLESLYAIADDGFYMYCSVCGQGGLLVVCEEPDCGRSFCDECLERCLGRNSYRKIKHITDWTCFLCSDYNEDTHGILFPRNDWKDQLVSFYNSPTCERYLEDLSGWNPGQTINILTMYDDAGATVTAIKDLGIEIGNSVALVKDDDAKHFLTVKDVADVRWTELASITSSEVKEMCPIDLVFVSLPREMFDISSQEMMSSMSFDEQVRFILRIESIIKEFDCMNGLHIPVYYLIEGPASMPTKIKNTISDTLMLEPSMWDAQFISPYMYPRYYWGNVPGLNRAVQCYNENKANPKTLDMYLVKLPERRAMVKYLRNPGINFDKTKRSTSYSDSEPDYDNFLYDMLFEEEYSDLDDIDDDGESRNDDDDEIRNDNNDGENNNDDDCKSSFGNDDDSKNYHDGGENDKDDDNESRQDDDGKNRDDDVDDDDYVGIHCSYDSGENSNYDDGRSSYDNDDDRDNGHEGDENDNDAADVSEITPHICRGDEDDNNELQFFINEFIELESDTESDIEQYNKELEKANSYDQYKLQMDEYNLRKLSGKFGVSIKEEYDEPNKSIHTLPAMMDDWRSCIWITEVESVIGFPKYWSYLGYKQHTDVSVQAKLLKKSSSVHLLKQIFKPLCLRQNQN